MGGGNSNHKLYVYEGPWKNFPWFFEGHSNHPLHFLNIWKFTTLHPFQTKLGMTFDPQLLDALILEYRFEFY